LYVKAGLEDGEAALLVLIGARTKGRKVVLAWRAANATARVLGGDPARPELAD
jgi:hypothetical protein